MTFRIRITRGMAITLATLAPAAISAAPAAAATTYTDRATYAAIAGAATSTENFSGFTADTPFRTTTVSANGFTLAQTGSNVFRNTVDVSPFLFNDNNGTPNASCFVNESTAGSPTAVVIGFSTPVRAFGADFDNVTGPLSFPPNSPGGGLQAAFFDGSTQIGSYLFPNLPLLSVQFFGVVAGAGEQITSIRLSSPTVGTASSGQGFSFDDATVTVPEPALTLLALAGAPLLRRRRPR